MLIACWVSSGIWPRCILPKQNVLCVSTALQHFWIGLGCVENSFAGFCLFVCFKVKKKCFGCRSGDQNQLIYLKHSTTRPKKSTFFCICIETLKFPIFGSYQTRSLWWWRRYLWKHLWVDYPVWDEPFGQLQKWVESREEHLQKLGLKLSIWFVRRWTSLNWCGEHRRKVEKHSITRLQLQRSVLEQKSVTTICCQNLGVVATVLPFCFEVGGVALIRILSVLWVAHWDGPSAWCLVCASCKALHSKYIGAQTQRCPAIVWLCPPMRHAVWYIVAHDSNQREEINRCGPTLAGWWLLSFHDKNTATLIGKGLPKRTKQEEGGNSGDLEGQINSRCRHVFESANFRQKITKWA